MRRSVCVSVLSLSVVFAACSTARDMNWQGSGDPTGTYRVSRSDIRVAAHQYLTKLLPPESDGASTDVAWAYSRVADFSKRYEAVEVSFLGDGTIVASGTLPWDYHSRFGRWEPGSDGGILIRDERGRLLLLSIVRRGVGLAVTEDTGDYGGPFALSRYGLVRVF